MSDRITLMPYDTLMITTASPTTVVLRFEPKVKYFSVKRRDKIVALRKRVAALEQENRLLRINSSVDDD